MPRSPRGKSDALIKEEGKTAKAQGKRQGENPYKGSQGVLESNKEYDKRRQAKEKWDQGHAKR